MSEVYISVDIEADGPIPGPNSMLSIGAVALLADRRQLGTFSMNIETLAGATPDDDTMDWWKTQPAAWEACRKDPQTPWHAMTSFSIWVTEMTVEARDSDGTPASPVFVGYPVGFDFLFVYWYLIKFAGKSPFSFSALDIKSYAMAVLNMPYRAVNKRALGRFMMADLPHTHVAVEDAVEQGFLFLNLMRHNNEKL